MKRTTLKSRCVEVPNKWHGNENNGAWEYGDYRRCYLTIRKLDNGKYRPNVGSDGNIPLPDKPLPPEGYFQFDTFEEAANYVFKYVDWIRDVWDNQYRNMVQKNLHKSNPNVFLA